MKGGVILGSGAYNCVIEIRDTVYRVMHNSKDSEIKIILESKINVILDDKAEARFVFPKVYHEITRFNFSRELPEVYEDLVTCARNNTFEIPERLIFSTISRLTELREVLKYHKDYLRASLTLMHDRNIVHLDIHPGNIMANHNLQPVFTDWDLAKILQEPTSQEDEDYNVAMKQKDRDDLESTFSEIAQIIVRKQRKSRSREKKSKSSDSGPSIVRRKGLFD